MASIFVLPPSIRELERRLRIRAQDDEAVIRRRMAKAADELSHWPEYDYVVVNDDLVLGSTATFSFFRNGGDRCRRYVDRNALRAIEIIKGGRASFLAVRGRGEANQGE